MRSPRIHILPFTPRHRSRRCTATASATPDAAMLLYGYAAAFTPHDYEYCYASYISCHGIRATIQHVTPSRPTPHFFFRYATSCHAAYAFADYADMFFFQLFHADVERYDISLFRRCAPLMLMPATHADATPCLRYSSCGRHAMLSCSFFAAFATRCCRVYVAIIQRRHARAMLRHMAVSAKIF